MMKLGSNIWSFHNSVNSGKLNQIEWLKMCREELDHDGVEILDFGTPERTESYLKKIKKLTTDLHLEVYAVSCSSNFGKAAEKERKEQVEYVNKWIDIGYFLGAPVVRYFAGSPEDNSEKTWGEMVRCTKLCIKHAEAKGIVLAVENHNHKGFIQTSKDVIKLYKEVKSPYFRLCLDTGNFRDLYASIEKTVNLAAFVHAKLYDLDKDGIEKRLDYERIFKILKTADYRGYLSVEFEGEEDEFSAMKRGCAYLRKMMLSLSV
ncbi:MAG: sugar phosphate isomerase/epimerase [Candidatus Omnitrophica bacterium]|nr:sugar phosphate isomerase/epimerase [Candidatus Omnitrophota bacterium]